MNVALRKPGMTREQFFRWAEAQELRYEFDGFQPVAMTGGNSRHYQMCQTLHVALGIRLRGKPCRPLGEAGLGTIGDTVRYPDGMVSCGRTADDAHLIEGVVIVFEVLSPTSGTMDRVVKVREYHAVPSIRRYVIFERRRIGATVYARPDAESGWTETPLAAGDMVELPEVGIAFPLDDIYTDTDLVGFPGGDPSIAPDAD